MRGYIKRYRRQTSVFIISHQQKNATHLTIPTSPPSVHFTSLRSFHLPPFISPPSVHFTSLRSFHLPPFISPPSVHFTSLRSFHLPPFISPPSVHFTSHCSFHLPLFISQLPVDISHQVSHLVYTFFPLICCGPQKCRRTNLPYLLCNIRELEILKEMRI